MPDKNAIFQHVAEVLARLFELEPSSIQLSSHMADDLDIDSIDAADLMVELKKYIGRAIDPERFKQVRTVEDVVNAISELLDEG